MAQDHRQLGRIRGLQGVLVHAAARMVIGSVAMFSGNRGAVLLSAETPGFGACVCRYARRRLIDPQPARAIITVALPLAGLFAMIRTSFLLAFTVFAGRFA